jgi:hypothetical protein
MIDLLGQLRGSGGHCGHQGYLQEISQQGIRIIFTKQEEVPTVYANL